MDSEQRSVDSPQSLDFDPNVSSALGSKCTSECCPLLCWAVHAVSLALKAAQRRLVFELS